MSFIVVQTKEIAVAVTDNKSDALELTETLPGSRVIEIPDNVFIRVHRIEPTREELEKLITF